MNLLKITSLLLSCLLMASSFNAFAEDIPANGACDELKGGAVPAGLFGLCVAYCNVDNATASEKLLDNFDRKNPGNYYSMPDECLTAALESDEVVVNACPAWSMVELNAIGLTPGATLQNDVGGTSRDGSFSISDTEAAAASFPDRTSWLSASAKSANGIYTGVYKHFVTYTDPTQGENVKIDRVFVLTAEEFGICKQQIIDHDI